MRNEEPRTKPMLLQRIDGATEEVSLYRALFRDPEGILNYLDTLRHECDHAPQLRALIDNLPEVMPTVTREEASSLTTIDPIMWHTKDSMSSLDYGEPSDLERLLLTLVLITDKDALKFDTVPYIPTASNFFPRDSFRCLRDAVRTKRFIRAVESAVQTQLDRGEDSIHVCDAGSGASSIFALTAALYSPKVHCTCIEGNTDSVRIARVIMEAFGLSDRVTVVNANATEYQPETPIDVLVSETMLSGLILEQQAQIMSHLLISLAPNAVLVPNIIETFAAIVPQHIVRDATTFRHIDDRLYPVFETYWTRSGIYNTHQPPPKYLEARLLNHNIGTSEPAELYIASRILFHDETSLEIGEARITSPLRVKSLPHPKQLYTITYKPGAEDFHDIHIR